MRSLYHFLDKEETRRVSLFAWLWPVHNDKPFLLSCGQCIFSKFSTEQQPQE